MSMTGWCVIIVAFVLAVLAWYYHRYFTLRKFLKHVQGPFPLPLVGNALDFSSRNIVLPILGKFFKQYGKIVLIYFGEKPVVAIADYEAMENVLGSNKLLEKSFQYRFLHSWLNDGLLVSSGRKWKQRRRILTSSYHFQILEQFVPIFNKVGDILVEQLKNSKNKNIVDIYPYITLSTLDVICETAMGVSVNAQLNKHSPYVQSVKVMGKIMIDRSFSAFQQYDITYRFTENYRKEKECLRILHGYTDSVIQRRREELSKIKSDVEKNEDDYGAKKRVAFLDMLLQAKNENGLPLSDADIREEVDTFMFEGHDTTASGISFALYEISNNPEVQKKIIEEQAEILQGKIREFTYNDLNKMKYLEMVIKETLRMYPSVPFYARKTNDDFQLSKDITVPAGCTISMIIYHIHRDPECFPEPEKFNPERFLAEKNLSKRPYSFVPFSAGPRNCIGQKFAYLEMKSIISKMVRSFELLPTVPLHKLDLTVETILKSDNGVLIKLKDRT